MFNKVVLVGNLTRDIELRYIQSGTAIANTAIATSRKFTSNGEKKEEVMFIDITFFGRSGEIANQYLRKGSKILVEGRLKFDQWVDQNGQKRSKHSINVENMQMLDSRNSAPDGQNTGGYNAPQQNGGYEPQQNSSHQAPSQYNAPQQPREQYNAPQQSPAPQQQKPQQSAPKMPENNLPEIDIDDDEIPF
ncbi:MAG: single-stranded DNA-binding protein [Campylobacterota bacterium]|nr:single-stranded DNA-binding protein [Campylobacterota bacterium]